MDFEKKEELTRINRLDLLGALYTCKHIMKKNMKNGKPRLKVVCIMKLMSSINNTRVPRLQPLLSDLQEYVLDEMSIEMTIEETRITGSSSVATLNRWRMLPHDATLRDHEINMTGIMVDHRESILGHLENEITNEKYSLMSEFYSLMGDLVGFFNDHSVEIGTFITFVTAKFSERHQLAIADGKEP